MTEPSLTEQVAAGPPPATRPTPRSASRLSGSDPETYRRLKLLMFFRVVFTTLLLGSTIILQAGKAASPLDPPLLVLYLLIVAIFLLSCLYAVWLPRVTAPTPFAYVQIALDTLIVTLVIVVTGSFASIFSFLYLVVIIYASMLLERGGSMIMAGLCSIQYGVMVNLEYYGLFTPFVMDASPTAMTYLWRHVLYKVLITTVGCFAVAFLSDMLAEQVRKSRKALREMEERVRRVEKLASMGEMAAGMAHELKNPLASLAGSIQLLQAEMPEHPVHGRLMHIALRETQRLNELLTNFLLFARPPAGSRSPLPLERALADTLAIFQKDTTCLGRIEVKHDLTRDLWVAMDPVHLRQVLWNLLLNAAEAIEGTGTIHLENRVLRTGRVEIRIRDTGTGMAPELVDSIFDPFFTTKADGTGLGLSIVHRILESYDGWLQVDTAPGQGSVFIVTLPLIDPPARAESPGAGHGT